MDHLVLVASAEVRHVACRGSDRQHNARVLEHEPRRGRVGSGSAGWRIDGRRQLQAQPAIEPPPRGTDGRQSSQGHGGGLPKRGQEEGKAPHWRAKESGAAPRARHRKEGSASGPNATTGQAWRLNSGGHGGAGRGEKGRAPGKGKAQEKRRPTEQRKKPKKQGVAEHDWGLKQG